MGNICWLVGQQNDFENEEARCGYKKSLISINKITPEFTNFQVASQIAVVSMLEGKHEFQKLKFFENLKLLSTANDDR